MNEKSKTSDNPTLLSNEPTPIKSDTWNKFYLPEARKDIIKLSPGQRIVVNKAITKVAQNPLPAQEGGYGKTLRGDLAGFLKIKLKSEGLRIIYKLERTEEGMVIVVIGARADEEVYDTAKARIRKYGL